MTPIAPSELILIRHAPADTGGRLTGRRDVPEKGPDLGPLDRSKLAEIAPPSGESFSAMVARVSPALADLAERAIAEGPVAVVAHAGTVRAGLAVALGDVPAALAFEVEPLSVTRLRCLPGVFSIVCVNGVA